MDQSKEGSPLFGVPTEFRRNTKSSNADDQSASTPWSLPPTGSYRRISDDIRSILSDTSDKQSNVAEYDTYPILHRSSRERPEVHTHKARAAMATRRRQLTLPSVPVTTENAIQANDFPSDEPSTSPKRRRRPRAQSIKKDDFKNAAFPRAARRYSMHDPSVDEEVTSYQAMSPGTLATVTDTRYSSHARAPRKLRQEQLRASRRHVTVSPPRTRVVLSRTPALSLSPSPPIDEFTDIPPVELILFEPRQSLTTDVQRPRHSERPLTSSPLKLRQAASKKKRMDKNETYSASPFSPDTASQPTMPRADVSEPPGSPAEPAAAGRVTYLHMWIFCLAVAGTLSLPLGIVILSYVATPNREMRNLTSAPFSMAKSSDTAITAVHTYHFPTPPTRPTVDPWGGVQRRCQQIKQISEDPHLVSPQRSPLLNQSGRPNIFCLYNNSRFRRGNVYDFLPQNIPFSICRKIVYWSFGIKDGLPTSRAKNFDLTYGLGKLREISNNSTIPGVKILLAMGGYPEDYAQLSLLGRENGALTRFVHSTMALMSSHVLDGVVIHWLEGEPICKSRAVNDAKMLNTVFVGLRRIFRVNGFPGQLAVIVPTSTSDTVALVDSVVDVVDFVFMETRGLWRTVQLDVTVCHAWSSEVVKLFKKHSLYTGNESKFCILMSVAPFLVMESSLPARFGEPPRLIKFNYSKYKSAPGIGNAFDMCRRQRSCLRSKPNSTLCIFVKGSDPANPSLLYMFNNLMTVADVFRSAAMRNLTDHCMLLVDLDLDNYAKQCGTNLGDYWFTRYFHAALDGTAPIYLLQTMPTC
ncbi:uncharacterized protein [Dermacentor albipictus]|uniref:uncharacterized protein n=1 Tax=Dermacentor albipictus TaxID=60249 RepID=UPI0038FBFA42